MPEVMQGVETAPASSKTPATTDSMPRQLWILAGILAGVRTLPYLLALLIPASASMVRLPVGYPDKDWYAYAAFIRQASNPDYLFLANPFTTEPQGGRFILLFHSLLGAIHSWTGLDALMLLELSRIPLVFAFIAVLWKFLAPVFPERRERIWCCWLVSFAGGIEYLLFAVMSLLPASAAATIMENMHCWTTFQGAANSLWMAGLTLLLICLAPLLRPERNLELKEQAILALATLALLWVHPYSGIMVLAVYAAQPVLNLILQAPIDWRRMFATGVPLAIAVFVFGAVALWQRQDPVYKICSGGFMGPQAIAVFWYPAMYGLLFVFAIRGWRIWIAEKHPLRFIVGAWTLAVILLHTSPLLNGYHFVFYLHVPLCIVATPAVLAACAWIANRPARTVWLGVLFIALFASSVFATARSIQIGMRLNSVPQEFMTVLEKLKTEKPGNVLCSAEQGNIIPAFTSHRVYVGHWFLTPNFEAKAAEYRELLRDIPANASRLRTLVSGQKIRYLFVPNSRVAMAQNILEDRFERAIVEAHFTVLVLKTD